MAVVESNKDTKIKLVTLKAGLDGVQRQSTRTLSNLAKNVENDALMQGVKAITELLETAPTAIVRVDETTLTEQG